MENRVKVLSWNVYWVAMLSKKKQCYNNICLKNVAKFIDNNGPYDFVGLQEATNWPNIQKASTVLSKMNAVSISTDLENQVLFYDAQKYEIIASHNSKPLIMGGVFGGGYRPFLVVPFKDVDTQRLFAVITLHAGHTNNDGIDQFEKFFLELSSEEKKFDEIINFVSNPRVEIIVLGDMNNDDALDNVFGKKLYGKTTKYTCCNSKSVSGREITNAQNKKYKSDHILYTKSGHSTNVLFPNMPTSDHLPVLAYINA